MVLCVCLMSSKFAHPIAEYLCRWKILGWEHLNHCFMDAVYLDRFTCTRNSTDVPEAYTVWFPDGSIFKRKDQRSLRWTKLLNQALKNCSKIVLVGDLVRCGMDNNKADNPLGDHEKPDSIQFRLSNHKQTNTQFRLTKQNAIMISG